MTVHRDKLSFILLIPHNTPTHPPRPSAHIRRRQGLGFLMLKEIIIVNSHPKFFLLFLFLCSGSPVRVVDSSILQEGGKDEDEAHDQVDVNGLDV